MAQCLLEVGHDVVLYQRRRGKPPQALAGGRWVNSLAEATEEAQVALTIVTDDAAEEAITFGPEGLLKHMGPGAIHLCMSTIGPETSRRLAQAHREAGQGYVAAPVLGSPRAAAHRHLWFIAGGPDAQVSRCLGILEALGRGVTRVGAQAELAHTLKLGTQMFAMSVVEALAEMLALGEKAGYSPASYLRLLNLGQFKSPQVDAWGALMVRRDHEPSDQTVIQAVKDLELARQCADRLGLDLPVAGQLLGVFAEALAGGAGGQDVTVLSSLRRRPADRPGTGPEAEPPVQPPAAPPPAQAEPAPAGPAAAETEPEPVQAGPTAGAAEPVAAEPVAAEPAPGEQAPTRPELGPEDDSPDRILQALPADVTAAEAAAIALSRAARQPKVWTWTRRTILRQSLAVDAADGAVPPEPAVPDHAAPTPKMELPPLPEPVVAAGQAVPAPLGTEPITYPVLDGNGTDTMDVDRTTHFEERNGTVWAWADGRQFATCWRNFAELEPSLPQVLFVRTHRNILLNPAAVLDVKPLFGGRAKVAMTDGKELTLGREATRKLKFILGI
jgi:3-hydroxyisobutyrate dehydrogenase-like beta-hydroxyacid dehydrogenase